MSDDTQIIIHYCPNCGATQEHLRMGRCTITDVHGNIKFSSPSKCEVCNYEPTSISEFSHVWQGIYDKSANQLALDHINSIKDKWLKEQTFCYNI